MRSCLFLDPQLAWQCVTRFSSKPKSFEININELGEPFFSHIADYDLEVVNVDFH